jgi:hypothetical protein
VDILQQDEDWTMTNCKVLAILATLLTVWSAAAFAAPI